MKEIKEALKRPRKALIKLNQDENNEKYNGVYINAQSPIYEALRMTPISELEYII